MAYLVSVLLAGCSCGGGEAVIFDPPPQPFCPWAKNCVPTIYGLEYSNSVTGRDLHLTTAAGRYVGYTASAIVTFVLGDIALFTVVGDLPHPLSSVYEADRYLASTLHTVENLMAF